MRALITSGCLSLLVACGGNTPPPQVPEPAPPPTTNTPDPNVEPSPAEPQPPAPAPEPTDASCDARPDPMSPVMLTRQQWDTRHGANITKLSELKTTKDEPAQACLAKHSYLWLSKLTCDDGSRPLPTSSAAAEARTGNVGPGGKCGNIVDRYRVSCPEGDVDVFIDMYWCTEAILAPAPKGA